MQIKVLSEGYLVQAMLDSKSADDYLYAANMKGNCVINTTNWTTWPTGAQIISNIEDALIELNELHQILKGNATSYADVRESEVTIKDIYLEVPPWNTQTGLFDIKLRIVEAQSAVIGDEDTLSLLIGNVAKIPRKVKLTTTLSKDKTAVCIYVDTAVDVQPQIVFKLNIKNGCFEWMLFSDTTGYNKGSWALPLNLCKAIEELVNSNLKG